MATTPPLEKALTHIELRQRGRRRLIGAVTIGLLGVVFLPMVFDSEPRKLPAEGSVPKQEISVQVPAKDGVPLLPAPSVLVAPTPTPALPPPVVPEKAVADVKDPPKEAPIVAPPTIATAAVSATPTPAKATVPPPVLKPTVIATAVKAGFAVQLGVFSDADNIKQVLAKMSAAKLPAYSDTIPIKSGMASRIRVGPFASRADADSALAQIKLAGSDGRVVSLP